MMTERGRGSLRRGSPPAATGEGQGSGEVDRGGADDGQSGCRDFSSSIRAERAGEAKPSRPGRRGV